MGKSFTDGNQRTNVRLITKIVGTLFGNRGVILLESAGVVFLYDTTVHKMLPENMCICKTLPENIYLYITFFLKTRNITTNNHFKLGIFISLRN